MGERRIRGLKAKVGRECSISRGLGWTRLSSRGVQAGGVREDGQEKGRRRERTGDQF